MINADKRDTEWAADTVKSVLQYNDWFTKYAPKAFREVRDACSNAVEDLFEYSDFLRDINPDLLINNPSSLETLRMVCSPPIARDRLAGLADVSRTQVKAMEVENRLPSRGKKKFVDESIPALLGVIQQLIDRDLMVWLTRGGEPMPMDLLVAKSVIADRLCGSRADPLIRNAQETRQLDVISAYLEAKGYSKFEDTTVGAFDMPHGTYAYHKNVSMFQNAKDASGGWVNTPVDVVIMPLDESVTRPMLVECKSAGDFANTNKRRKEEDTKVTQLRATYGNDVILYLFLCGYFDNTYLGYEAANHMDWIWEHRVEDFERAGI